MSKFTIDLPHFVINTAFVDTFDFSKPDDVWRGVHNYDINQLPQLSCIRNMKSNLFYKQPESWLTHKLPEYQIDPHIDNDRDTVIVIPLQPNSYDLIFLENLENLESEVFRHTYKCPALLNAKIPHYVNDKGIERFFIQISFYIKDYSWNKVKEWAQNEKLFNNRQQTNTMAYNT